MKVSLTTAFKMRNEIKKVIATKQRLLSNFDFSVNEEKKDLVDYHHSDGKTIDQTLDEILVAQKNLAVLNTKIDTANLPNREICHQIDAVKANLSSLSYLEDVIRKFSPKKVVKSNRDFTPEEMTAIKNGSIASYSINREEEKIENWVLLFDAEKCKQRVIENKKFKNQLEAELSLANAKTEVEIEEGFNNWYNNFIF